jgi:[ribosomal protein S18]-alanine N-acetyltransferase
MSEYLNTESSIVRYLKLSDLENICTLEELCFMEDSWSKSILSDSISNENGLALGVFDSDILQGYAFGTVIACEAELHNIAIHPVNRRSGLGLYLLKYFLNECRSRESRICWLEVRESNQAAIRLYQNNGFKGCGRRPRYYQDGEDALVYCCDL